MQPRLSYCALLVFSLMAFSGLGRASLQKPNNAQPQESAQANPEQETEDPLGRNTPHGTVVGFLQAAQHANYHEAAEYLQLSKSERASSGERIAQQLHDLVDEAFVGRVGTISNRREGSGSDESHETIGTFNVDDSETNVDLVRVSDARGDRIWLFSAKTLAEVPELTDHLEIDRIGSKLPAFLTTRRVLHTPLWRWLTFLLLIPVSYGLARGLVRLLQAGFDVWLRRHDHPLLEKFILSTAPLTTLILTVIFHRIGVYFLGISLLVRVYYNRIILFVLLTGFAWLGFRLINAWAEHARRRALRGSGAGSGSVVILGQRILKVLLVVLVALVMLSILGVDITAAVAGLGIGSIAVAFAAQKTLENLLGGISILGDEVIRVGDICRIGDHVGTVEDISLRSTRIRTLERTELSVPNGQLANMNVENLTRSDRSLFRTTLELRRETSPDRLSVLLKEMRGLLNDRPEVIPEGTRVRFIGFGESSLEVEIFCHIRTTKLLEFLEIREDLLLRIMKLVEAAGVEFAIPARSLYFNEDQGGVNQRQTAEARTVSEIRNRL